MNFKTQPILIPMAFIMAAMLASCSITTPRHSPDNTSYSMRVADHLAPNEVLRYYTFLHSLNDAGLVKEYQTAQLRFAETKSVADRLKLAVLLSVPDTTFHNIPEAVTLLKALPVDTTYTPSDLAGLSNLLATLLSQQQQADDKLSDMTKSLAEERARAKLLQEKIDAVRDMEINMIQRGQP